MKKIFCLCILFTCFTVTVFGQSKKEYSSALVDLFKATGMDKTYIVAMESILDVMKDAYTDVPDTFWSMLENEMLSTSIEELADLVTPVYMDYLSLEDIEAITDFYKSTVGQKYASSAADIYTGCVAAGEEWGEKMGKRIAKKLEEAGY